MYNTYNISVSTIYSIFLFKKKSSGHATWHVESSAPPRDWTLVHCTGSIIRTTGPPEKSPMWYQFSSVARSCPTLCDPMDCSTSSLLVHHQLLDFTQTHVHRVSDAIQPSHPLLSPLLLPQPLPASGSFPMSQPFEWGGQSVGVSASALVLPMNIQDWFPLGWTGWIFLLSKGYI